MARVPAAVLRKASAGQGHRRLAQAPGRPRRSDRGPACVRPFEAGRLLPLPSRGRPRQRGRSRSEHHRPNRAPGHSRIDPAARATTLPRTIRPGSSKRPTARLRTGLLTNTHLDDYTYLDPQGACSRSTPATSYRFSPLRPASCRTAWRTGSPTRRCATCSPIWRRDVKLPLLTKHLHLPMTEQDPVFDFADRAFREALEDADNLRALLRRILGPTADSFDYDQRRILPRDFLLPNWQGRERDFLCEIPFRLSGEERWALVCILIEHQTRPIRAWRCER